MSANRLRTVTALALAALYGAVGITGESIHYLATDAWGVWANLRKVDAGGYYHVHAPDFHGHFHRHSHDGHHSHGGHSHDHAVASHSHESESLEAAFREAGAETHHEHACPMLSLVSTLKLSHSSGCIATIILDAINAPVAELNRRVAFEPLRILCARGPPAGIFA
jgi:hypothetical protein